MLLFNDEYDVAQNGHEVIGRPCLHATTHMVEILSFNENNELSKK